MKLSVSGLLNIETTVAVRGFPINYYPIDYPFFGVNSAVSGVGYNIAKALTTLSDEVQLLSFLGNDDEGDRVMTQLMRDGISVDGVTRTLKSTPTSVVLYDPAGKRQIYCDLKDIQEQRIAPESITVDGCAAAICNINFNRDLIKSVHNSGVLTATDVHVLSNIEDDYNRDFMENADILFLSDEALPCEPAQFLRQLHARYRNHVIVLGMGSKGAMLLDGESGKLTRLSACQNVKVVNTVGAGDALFAAFLHFTAKGRSPIDALTRAQVFAAIKIGADGASKGFCTEAEIEEKLPLMNISVKELWPDYISKAESKPCYNSIFEY